MFAVHPTASTVLLVTDFMLFAYVSYIPFPQLTSQPVAGSVKEKSHHLFGSFLPGRMIEISAQDSFIINIRSKKQLQRKISLSPTFFEL